MRQNMWRLSYIFATSDSQYHLRHTFGSSVYRFKDVAVIIDNRDKLSETKF